MSIKPKALVVSPAGAEPQPPAGAEPQPPARPDGPGFDLDRPWRLADQVAARREPFGALLYHFGTRRLSFVTNTTLLTVVRSLAAHPDARSACVAAGVTADALPAYRRALATLAASRMIVAAARPPARRQDRTTTSAFGCPSIDTAAQPDGTARAPRGAASATLTGRFQRGLTAPICLTWELTYACNLACVHCLSSSGRRDPRELSTTECETVIDTLQRMGVFYVNIGGGEPTVRPDFWHLVDYATGHRVGVKFSTNGVRIDAAAARRLAGSDYVDVQISLDGATPEVNDAVRGAGSYAVAVRAMAHLAAAGMTGFKLSTVVTRHNVGQLDRLKALADRYGAQLRLTRLRPSGRGADSWHDLHPTAEQQRQLYDWLVAHGEQVLTGDSFFHLSPYGTALPGLNMCGAGRVVCLIDPVGDVYACPFAIHDTFLAGNVRQAGGFAAVWRDSALLARLRQPTSGGACGSCRFFDSCHGGCMAAKFFTGLPVDGPDPECVRGHGAATLHAARGVDTPRAGRDHSHRGPVRGQPPVPVTIGRRPAEARPCADHPLAGFAPGTPAA